VSWAGCESILLRNKKMKKKGSTIIGKWLCREWLGE
jgi:hypothetical protein